MKEKNIDQDELAQKLEVNRSSVSQWVTGRTTPRGKKINRIAEIFGVTINQLMYSEAELKKEDTNDAYIRELEQKLMKAQEELLVYKTRENEKLKNNQSVPSDK